ncbi:hypothetical protein DEJ57_08815 [Campylobacter coli]|nr:hypothetical protein [Campylobacter coli]EAK5627462.1 hypothetical protein [Campylobacter coli]
MFLDIISKIFIFVAIHAMIIFIIKSHIAVIKTSLKYFDFRFINFQARKLSLIEARDELLFF